MKTHLTKEEIQMPNKHEKRCSKLLDIKEIQIKYKARCHFTLSIIAVINKRNERRILPSLILLRGSRASDSQPNLSHWSL